MESREIVCVDGKFPPDAAEFFKQHGCSLPQQDKLYSIREVVNHRMRDAGPAIGLLLNEIQNPSVPTKTPVGTVMREPTWHINRFRYLDGSPLEEEELKEMERQNNLTNKLNF